MVQKENSMKKMSREGKIKILLHLLAWSILLGLPLYSAKRFQLHNDFLLIYYTITLINGLIFYINYLVLVPKFFFQKRRLRYYISALILIICFYFVSDISNKLIFRYVSGKEETERFSRPPEEMGRPMPPRVGLLRVRFPFRQAHILTYTTSSLFLIFFSLGLRVLERQSKIEKMQEEMERTKLNSELAFLKNQISPHFFFNTLNNIYSLIGINTDDSQKAVLKLSKLMRYLLYESEHGDTKLSQEIDFMKNYIDLMKLRMSDKVTLSVSFPKDYDDLNMPPLLFIPFIENAFKHGISYREKSFIDISMVAGKNSITFKCANSIVKKNGEAENGNSGIGLENVSKRLSLLYPGKHDLKINRSDSTFEVLLLINFA
jgi:two-component system, LytTR family, sensor kinase